MLFPPNSSFFCKKIGKILDLEKLKNLIKNESLSGKKGFQSSKKHLCKNWRAESMPVVASFLVELCYCWGMWLSSYAEKLQDFGVQGENNYRWSNWNEFIYSYILISPLSCFCCAAVRHHFSWIMFSHSISELLHANIDRNFNSATSNALNVSYLKAASYKVTRAL